MAEGCQGSSGCKAGTHSGQDTFLSQSHSRTPALTQSGIIRHANLPHVHIFGMWEETGAPEENPRRHGENVQTPSKQWTWLGIYCFPHQPYNKMMLNETMLFEDLMYYYGLNCVC